MADRHGVEALLTSLALAAGAATVAVLLGGAVAYGVVRTRARGRGALAALLGLPLAVPGTVLALGLVLAWTSPVRLRDTVWILLVAYVAKHAALAARAIGEGLGTVDESLADAARVSGARGWFLARTIWLPLVLPSVAAGWVLVFLPAFSELTMSVLLVGPGIETVGTRLFELEYEGGYPQASAMAAVVLTLVVASSAMLGLFVRGRRRA
jgi:iron(III) transport system permease protein